MNLHGLKEKKKALREELREEQAREYSSRVKIINLENKIKGVCRQIRERKRR